MDNYNPSPDKQTATQQQQQIDNPDLNKQKNILIVEDDSLLRDLYSELISSAGYLVDTAVDGEVALQKLRQNTYDLVLLDILIPKLNAMDVLTRLKADPEAKGQKRIYFMTNLAQESLYSEAKELGVSGVIIKSEHNPEEFLQKVQTALSDNNATMN